MELFKGYVPTKDKKCLIPFKDVPANELKTYNEVKDLPEFAGILANDVILIDVDDKEQSDKLMDVVEDLQLNCRVYETTRGRHFLFKNDKVDKCGTHLTLAIGLTADIKIGSKNSYSILKYNGIERFIEWDSDEYDYVPRWLTSVKYAPNFGKMGTGDGRNQELFNYILNLQSNGFTKDECKQCIKIINKYVLAEPLSDKEIDTILRDESFKTDIFFDKKQFLFDKFANYLKNEYHIVKINGQLHIYNNGVYDYATKIIEAKMIEKIPTLTAQRRTEVMKYLELICDEKEQSEANYIAFKNGIYDITTDELLPYTPDVVITNRINHNFNPNAYHELADHTLNKLACGDKEIRALLEECIGACFYRRNELAGGKAFILTGDKSNGKSTFLDLIKAILGESNISALDLRELGDRFSTSMLFGKLANIGDDIGDEFMQGNAVAIFKKIVTGNRLKAEQKGKDPFEFNPYVKLLFSANDMPRMRDKTGAVIRRLVMIPFNATFSKNDADYDPFIKYKLIKEDSLEYLIQLGIQGLKRVLTANEFTKSGKVDKVLTEYEEENNPILAFINETGEDRILNQPTNEVYLRYTVFCSQNQLQALSKIAFSKLINKKFGTQCVSRRINNEVVRLFLEGGN